MRASRAEPSRFAAISRWAATPPRSDRHGRWAKAARQRSRGTAMKRLLIGGLAALCLSASAAFANGYPSGGRAIDQLHPAADYSDLAGGRPLALGIMRARAQGFVPSAVLQTYTNGVLAKLLRGVALPASFHPQVRVL